MTDPVAAKYLAKYAEQEARDVKLVPAEPYRSAVVIPAFAEDIEFVRRLFASRQNERRLVILVVNARENAPTDALAKNETLLEAVRSSGELRPVGEGMELVETKNASVNWLLVDATSPGRRLGDKEGVGRARKKGLDVALSLFECGALSCHMVASTDADVTIPEGYFESLERALPDAAALLFPYRHQESTDRALGDSMRQVEMSFRYYVLGLAFAGSPYAYHSLGSALAVNLHHYSRVRGVPNRRAGEDFYLLSKLSKLAPLYRLAEPTIEIETRLSHRVPFGTGPALQKAIDEGGELEYYDPKSFVWLRAFLRAVIKAARTNSRVIEFDVEVPDWVKQKAQETLSGAAPHLRACPTEAHREHRIHERVDALTTLQFIHRCHREQLRMVPISQALSAAEFIDCPNEPSEVAQALRTQESALPSQVGLKPA